MPPPGLYFPLFPAQSSRTKTEFIGFAGNRARTSPAPGLYFPLFPAQSSRSKTEFIGFAGRRARTEPGPGPLFRFLPAQSSRSKTEFIGFAGRRARTLCPMPEPGPLADPLHKKKKAAISKSKSLLPLFWGLIDRMHFLYGFIRYETPAAILSSCEGSLPGLHMRTGTALPFP